MILAAGLGTRMRPLTRLRAKPALPVLGRPLIQWTLEALARHGIREVVINLHHLPDTVRDAVGPRMGLAVSYSREPRILGTGGGPRRVRRFFGDEPALLINGDVLFDFDLTRLVRAHRRAGAAVTLALKPQRTRGGYSRVVMERGGRVTCLPGSHRRPRGRPYLFTGVQVLDPIWLERLPSGRSDSVRDLYARLVDAGDRVRGLVVRGPWHDLGTPQGYRRGQLAALGHFLPSAGARGFVARDATVSASARVRRSVLGRGVRVRTSARIAASVLWEGTVVGEGARVERSIVAGAEVPAEAVIADDILVPRGPWRP
jgi:NDP-sugar pyrophosphorylase family protein